MNNTKVLVVSGINFFEGGPLSVMKDCLKYLADNRNNINHIVIALVHKKELFAMELYPGIRFIEFPKSRKSYLYRLYYEYVYFKQLSQNLKVSFWLSLHDITPNVGGISQAVYCHNPSPFNDFNVQDLYTQPTQFLFRLFYRFLYKINIKQNKFVIVQQLWIKKRFKKMFHLENGRIIVATPQVPNVPIDYLRPRSQSDLKKFFYPAFPRPFKNIEVICQAVAYLNNFGIKNYTVIITIDGTENIYSRNVVNQYQHLENIQFVGLLSRDEVYQIYGEIDCLIFPSKLETWGLPISEFKQFNKPILASDLPYAKETAGSYRKIKFFDHSNPNQLASLMRDYICQENIAFDITESETYPEPYAKDWEELFKILLKDNTHV